MSNYFVNVFYSHLFKINTSKQMGDKFYYKGTRKEVVKFSQSVS